jgi:hypothetical protein
MSFLRIKRGNLLDPLRRFKGKLPAIFFWNNISIEGIKKIGFSSKSV